tara:strand:+ start:40 stop:261 length:222 start_codon:yes stop_codon:yes gene_type:complete
MKEMKNMAYWKRKNALPGITHESDKNLPDGRSTSSPFQSAPTKLMGRLKKKVNEELETPAGQMAVKAATGGML